MSAAQDLGLGLSFADDFLSQLPESNSHLPVLTLKFGVAKDKVVVFAFFLVEVVEVELADEARKFAETEKHRDDLSLHSGLVLD